MLDALDHMGVANNTVVALWGDHGWKLGEHATWSKQDIWETGARVPLVLRTPWVAASRGQHTFELAETVDMFKTLADLSGLPPPSDAEGVQASTTATHLTSHPSNACTHSTN